MALTLDGERFLPWMAEPIINYEHLHRYAFVKGFAKGKKVLDLACGEGYGSAMLAHEAVEVTGADINKAAVEHAAAKYKNKNLKYIYCSATKVSINGEKLFDLIICFEALEHIEDQDKVLAEIKRLLKDDGLFIVSMPNKYIFSDLLSCINPWHKKELYLDEFELLLKNNFKYSFLYGQNVYPASNIFSLSDSATATTEYALEKCDGLFRFVPLDKKRARYFIAICSSLPVNEILASYLVDISANAENMELSQNTDMKEAFLTFQRMKDRIFPLGSMRRRLAKSVWNILKRIKKVS